MLCSLPMYCCYRESDGGGSRGTRRGAGCWERVLKCPQDRSWQFYFSRQMRRRSGGWSRFSRAPPLVLLHMLQVHRAGTANTALANWKTTCPGSVLQSEDKTGDRRIPENSVLSLGIVPRNRGCLTPYSKMAQGSICILSQQYNIMQHNAIKKIVITLLMQANKPQAPHHSMQSPYHGL